MSKKLNDRLTRANTSDRYLGAVLHVISTEHSIQGDILVYIECPGRLVFQNERNMQESVSIGKNTT